MKCIAFGIVLVLCGLAWAENEPVPIVAQESVVNDDGSYKYSYETGDGVKASQTGTLKKIDAETVVNVVEGSYSFPGEDGKPVIVEYTADETGFHPKGEHLPQVPPLIARALQYIAEHPQKDAQ